MSEITSQKEFLKYFVITCFNCDEEPDMIPFNPELTKDQSHKECLPMRFDCPHCKATIFISWKEHYLFLEEGG